MLLNTLKLPGSVFLIVFLLAGALRADTLFLREGKTIEGKITGFTSTTITIRNAAGVQTISKKTVSRVSYGPYVDPTEKKKQEEARKKIEEQKRLADEKRRAEAEREAEPEAEPEEAAEPVPDESEEAAAESDGPALSRIVKSAVLPGWGHISEGAPITGGLYLGLTAVAAGATYGLRAQALRAGDSYHTSVLLNNIFATRFVGGGTSVTDDDNRRTLLVSYLLNVSAHEPYASAVNDYNTMLGADLVLYLLQLAHITFFPPAQATGSLAPEFNFAIAPELASRYPRYGPDHDRRHGDWDARARITFFLGDAP